MIFLTKEQILLIHSIIIDETGGSHGIRDYHTILSLENLPKQKAFGKELYSTIFLKAAVYARNIITGHPFVDGNKRTGISTSSIFLENNGYKIIAIEGAIKSFALEIIHKKLQLDEIALWFEKNSKKIKKLKNNAHY